MSQPDEPLRTRGSGWLGVARSARARILISYIVMLALSAIISIFAIRQVLLIRLDDRIQDAGLQEVLELEALLNVGRDPETGQAFASPEALFDAYLARNVPSNEEGLVTYVDGEFHRQVLGRFPLARIPPEQDAEWARLSSNAPGRTELVEGRFETAIGPAHFRVRRVDLGGSTGAFVVAVLPAQELAEIAELQIYGVVAMLIVLLVASAVAWLIAGRALAPVRLLTETARSISQSDLTRRIEVSGAGDAAAMARSFNAMLDRLENVFRSQRAFVQDAGHELRDPLTICRGHLELLGDDPKERQRTIELVLDELDRMARIVDDLQVLADAQQPDFLRPERIELAFFTDELAAKASALAQRHWVLDDTPEGAFRGDRHRLTEAVMNLAHNAVQHTQAGDTIAIGGSLTDDEARIWVRDTGTGITISDKARIFDRFQRGRTAHRRYRGAGLGLAIVKAVAERHGGRVGLESEVDKGSTFTIVTRRYPDEVVVDGQDPDR
jgi:two-component system, OmpR family, sensor kinase